MFFGESMFSLQSNASKMAFVALAKLCRDHSIEVIDCQVHNEHLVYSAHKQCRVKTLKITCGTL